MSIQSFLIGFLVCYFVLFFLWFLQKEYQINIFNIWVVKPCAFIVIAIWFVPSIIIELFSFLMCGISEKEWELLQRVWPNAKKVHLFGNIYFWHKKEQKGVRGIINANRFLRIKK